MTTTAPAPEGVSIRPAERADLLDVIRIERSSFPQPWPYEAFEYYLGDPGFLVADDGATAVGYVVADVVSERGGRMGHVKDFAVHPDRRGGGIGTLLLSRALSLLGGRDVARVKLEVRAGNGRAISLYERFGFEFHHAVSGYYADGEDAHVLVCDLRTRPRP